MRVRRGAGIAIREPLPCPPEALEAAGMTTVSTGSAAGSIAHSGQLEAPKAHVRFNSAETVADIRWWGEYRVQPRNRRAGADPSVAGAASGPPGGAAHTGERLRQDRACRRD